MSIYISRSNPVPEEFLMEFKEHLRSLGYIGKITNWQRGSSYSTEPLAQASLVFLLIDSSACLIGKGSYEEYLFALSRKIPIFLGYKTKNYGFQFYCFSVDRINSNAINCAKITFGVNRFDEVTRILLGLNPISNTGAYDGSDFNIEKYIEPGKPVLNIELLLLRPR